MEQRSEVNLNKIKKAYQATYFDFYKTRSPTAAKAPEQTKEKKVKIKVQKH